MKRLLFFFTLVFIACDEIIEVVDISHENMGILAPIENSILNDSNVIFTWSNIEEAEFYHLQIATPSFENASQIIEDTLVIKTNFLKTLEPANYQWRIRGENSNYQTQYTTTSFLVE